MNIKKFHGFRPVSLEWHDTESSESDATGPELLELEESELDMVFTITQRWVRMSQLDGYEIALCQIDSWLIGTKNDLWCCTCACISWCNIKWVLWLDLRSKTRWDPTKIYSVILSVISIRWIYDEIYIYKKNFKKQTILTHQKKTFEHHKKRENSKVFVVDTHHEKVWSHSLWHREDHTHFLLGSLRYFFDTQHIQKS